MTASELLRLVKPGERMEIVAGSEELEVTVYGTDDRPLAVMGLSFPQVCCEDYVPDALRMLADDAEATRAEEYPTPPLGTKGDR